MMTLELAEDIINDRGLGEDASSVERIEAFAYVFKVKRLGYLTKAQQAEFWEMIEQEQISDKGEVILN